MPAANGRFAQVSGLCFRYDVTASVGSRVIASSVVRQVTDGSCTGAAVNLTTTANCQISPDACYTLATNDFTASGGDGYPDLNRETTREPMDEVLAAYIDALDPPPINPTIQGRIRCTGAGCPAGSNP
jgi:2',3'-cyclic-nucleotide 2'-phosphodiesterase (5'-nucleotidase family)